MSARVFLSYASRDREFAKEISSALNSMKVSVIDPVEIVREGDTWSDDVISELKNSDMVVFITPKFSSESSLTLAELGAARALGKPIVPVVQEPGWYATSGIANVVSGSQALDASRLNETELAYAIISLGQSQK